MVVNESQVLVRMFFFFWSNIRYGIINVSVVLVPRVVYKYT